MAVPMYVEINSGVKQFELRYTAATLLENAELTIQVPLSCWGNYGMRRMLCLLQDPLQVIW